MCTEADPPNSNRGGGVIGSSGGIESPHIRKSPSRLVREPPADSPSANDGGVLVDGVLVGGVGGEFAGLKELSRQLGVLVDGVLVDGVLVGGVGVEFAGLKELSSQLGASCTRTGVSCWSGRLNQNVASGAFGIGIGIGIGFDPVVGPPPCIGGVLVDGVGGEFAGLKELRSQLGFWSTAEHRFSLFACVWPVKMSQFVRRFAFAFAFGIGIGLDRVVPFIVPVLAGVGGKGI